MTGPLDPTQLTPDKWQEVLRHALADLRANHNDSEALQAVKDANEALSAYDQAEAASPAEFAAEGLRGGIHAAAKTGLNTLMAPYTLAKSVVGAVTDPEGAAEHIDQATNRFAEGVKNAVTNPMEA